MSRSPFPDELEKVSHEISIIGQNLKSINKVLLQDGDCYPYNINEVYKRYQSNINYDPSLTCNVKNLEFLTKCALDDFKSAELLPSTKNANVSSGRFSLSNLEMSNHIDRIEILTSLSRTKEDIQRKKEILYKLKEDRRDCDICVSVGQEAKMTYLTQELNSIRMDRSDVKKEITQLMASARLLNELMTSFQQLDEVIMRMTKTINEDSELTERSIKSCHQKQAEVKHQISAVKCLFSTIKIKFEHSLDCLKKINNNVGQKASQNIVLLDHFGRTHDESKAYNLIMCLVDSYKTKCELSPLRDGIKSRNHDYMEESKTISKNYGIIVSHVDKFNLKITNKLDLMSTMDDEVGQVIARINKVFTEWSELKDIIQ